MTALRTTCDRCSQPLHIPVAALLLVVGQDEDETVAWLLCTTCDDLVPLSVPAAVAASVLHAGAHVVASPDAVPHPEQRPDGPPLSRDELLALHELLTDDDAVEAAVARISAAGSEQR